MSEKQRLDAISITVDGQLNAWLSETAATADTVEEEAALVAGVLAGLCRFLWASRKPDTTKENVVEFMRSSADHFLSQAQDAEIGGHA